MRQRRQINRREPLSDNEGEEGESEGKEEPEEALIAPRHALSKLAFEKGLLCCGQASAIRLSTVCSEFDEAC